MFFIVKEFKKIWRMPTLYILYLTNYWFFFIFIDSKKSDWELLFCFLFLLRKAVQGHNVFL